MRAIIPTSWGSESMEITLTGLLSITIHTGRQGLWFDRISLAIGKALRRNPVFFQIGVRMQQHMGDIRIGIAQHGFINRDP